MRLLDTSATMMQRPGTRAKTSSSPAIPGKPWDRQAHRPAMIEHGIDGKALQCYATCNSSHTCGWQLSPPPCLAPHVLYWATGRNRHSYCNRPSSRTMYHDRRRTTQDRAFTVNLPQEACHKTDALWTHLHLPVRHKQPLSVGSLNTPPTQHLIFFSTSPH